MLRSSRSTVSARLRLSMRTPDSMLLCSALQQKFALGDEEQAVVDGEELGVVPDPGGR